MKKRIFSAIFLVSLVLIILITTVVTWTYYSSYSKSQLTQLKEEAQLVIRGVELDGEAFFDSITLEMYRVTWIKEDGTVIYDSKEDLATLENHLEREEVSEALESGYGESKRYSKTILQESIYVAYKIEDGSIVRLSCAQNSVFYLIYSTLYPLYYVAFIALVAAIVLAIMLSKKIITPLNNLDLENISGNKVYPEIEPLLNRIELQKKQLVSDKQEIEKNSILRQEFTANVSHEMKTPLHVIAGYSELMRAGMVKEEEIKEFSNKIYIESYRMTKLVDDILELSKLDNNAIDEEAKEISLDLIAKNAIDSLKSVMEEKHIHLYTRLEPITIIGASSIIYSMVYNLIDNAIKYNKENGEISIIVDKRDFKPTIIVSDTGIGIPKEDIPRIFERFYRVDKSHSREIGGTGLGLSIVKHAALVHNAKIDVESVKDEGTTFKVTFP